ncbi:hypothetical protein NBRC116593_29160 [Sulfitobacter pacificus]
MNLKVVRSERKGSNSFSVEFADTCLGQNDPFSDDLTSVFEELERWDKLLSPIADELGGPKP